MKNSHLIPVVLHDVVIQLENPRVGENERMALTQRLEAIKEFCIKALNRQQRREEELKKKPLKKVYKN